MYVSRYTWFFKVTWISKVCILKDKRQRVDWNKDHSSPQGQAFASYNICDSERDHKIRSFTADTSLL